MMIARIDQVSTSWRGRVLVVRVFLVRFMGQLLRLLLKSSQGSAQESPSGKGMLRILIPERLPFPTKFALMNTGGEASAPDPYRGFPVVSIPSNFGAKSGGVRQLVHAASRVYQWKLSVLRRELVSGYSVVVGGRLLYRQVFSYRSAGGRGVMVTSARRASMRFSASVL